MKPTRSVLPLRLSSRTTSPVNGASIIVLWPVTMPTWPVRFDGVPTEVKSAPLLGEHTAEVLADWLGLDAAAVAGLRQDGIV